MFWKTKLLLEHYIILINTNYIIPILDTPVVLSSSPSDTIVELVASFSLDCSYEGFPSPLVIWIMNNVLLTNESSLDVTIQNIVHSSTRHTSRLSGTIPSSQSSPGKYSCIIANSAGITISTFDVYLKGKPILKLCRH